MTQPFGQLAAAGFTLLAHNRPRQQSDAEFHTRCKENKHCTVLDFKVSRFKVVILLFKFQVFKDVKIYRSYDFKILRFDYVQFLQVFAVF